MDSDPLVPTEVSPTKKYVIFGVLGALALYMFIVFIVVIIEAKKFGHAGSYLAAFGLFCLFASIVALNFFIPQEALMENKAKYALLAIDVMVFVVATGILMMSFQKTPCKPCPAPNMCTLANAPEGQWINLPECFSADRNATSVAISPNRTCPPQEQLHSMMQSQQTLQPLVFTEAEKLLASSL